MNILIRKRITKALLLILLVFAIGTFGFHFLLDGLTFIDSLYLTVVTLAIEEYGCFRQDLRKPIIFRDGIKMTSLNQLSMKRVKKLNLVCITE